MARVTTEDCINKIPNPFDLVLLASHRVHEISAGSPLTIDRDHDKDTVVALREISEETISIQKLKESTIKSLQKYVESDDEETPFLDEMLAEESHWLHGQEAGNIAEELKEDDLSVTDELDADTMESDIEEALSRG